MPATRRAVAVLLLLGAVVRPLHAQTATRARPTAQARQAPAGGGQLTTAERRALLQIAAVEDARALGAGGTEPLVTALADPSPVVRRAAVRALGRLQRPDLLADIEQTVDDANPLVRAEGVNAIAQSLQGVRALDPASAARRRALDDGVDALIGAAERQREPLVLAVAARSLGRLPFVDSIVPRAVERIIVQMGERPGSGGRPLARSDASVAAGMLHGLYALARSSRVTGSPSPEALSAMRWATTFGLDSVRPARGRAGASASASGAVAVDREGAAQVRRLAYLALGAARDTSSALARRALLDPDEQVRRLGVLAAVALADSAVRRVAVASALRDPSFLVRFEGVRSYRTLAAPRTCLPLFRATRDANPHVVLAAIDALGAACDDRGAAADSLARLAATPVAAAPTRAAGGTSWHVRAHALLALARLSPATVAGMLRQDALHPVWQVRLYVARAALVARDTLTLSALAFDVNGNVREAALAGISETLGHAADRVYVSALSALDYQVVLRAAQALRGTPMPDSVVPALFAALERLTAEQRENSRDPRVALVERIGELGSERHGLRLAPYVTDFDSTVAARASTIVERWTLRRAAAAPRRLSLARDPVDEVIGSELRLLVRIAARSGGGVFVVRLLPDEAPLTVARIVRLAREGYYAGLTFHRVEPTFVIQGGSPAATEYVGDGPFMRDEVGLPSHLRGSLGISTRGRDTGDAQLFVNLTDNVRLDHDYTVFGEIIQGRAIAEGLIEGDVIERVDVVRVR